MRSEQTIDINLLHEPQDLQRKKLAVERKCGWALTRFMQSV